MFAPDSLRNEVIQNPSPGKEVSDTKSLDPQR
jgi:hypothetical protein